MLIEIEKPIGNNCTGCPMSNLFYIPNDKVMWHYGCNYLHKEMEAGGEFQNYGIKGKNCPFLKGK